MRSLASTSAEAEASAAMATMMKMTKRPVHHARDNRSTLPLNPRGLVVTIRLKKTKLKTNMKVFYKI
jgi:hypothetical protein